MREFLFAGIYFCGSLKKNAKIANIRTRKNFLPHYAFLSQVPNHKLFLINGFCIKTAFPNLLSVFLLENALYQRR